MDTTEKIKKEKKKIDWGQIKDKFKQLEWRRFGLKYQTIRVRLLFSFSLVIVFMIALGIGNYITFNRVNESIEEIVEEDFVLQQNYDKISYYMAQRISAVRGYLLTGRESYIVEFNNYKQWSKENEELISKLDNSISNQNLFATMNTWNETVQENVFDLVADGNRAEAMLNMNGNVNPKAEQIISDIAGRATTKSAEIRLEINALMKTIDRSINTMIIAVIVIILLSIAVAIFFANYFSKAISSVVIRLKSLQDGLLNQELLEVEGAGELAELGHSANALQESLYEIMTIVSLGAEDLAQQSEELSQSSNEVKSGSEQVAITMQELSIGTENQAHSASTLAANMESYNEKFTDVYENSGKVTEYSEDVLNLSGKGKELMNSSSQQMEKINEIVQDATLKMSELDKGTKEISKLVDIIQSVSKQTNLLALNAAIEAARAGEHGRGFAVVAEEVRKLSEQVADSVKEITLFVENINREANDVSDSLQEGYKEAEEGLVGIKATSDTFDEITNSLQNVVVNINDIRNNLQGLTETGQEMNHSISEIASVSEESAAGVEETSAASQQINSTMEEVSVNAGQIAKLAEEMNQIVQKFQLFP